MENSIRNCKIIDLRVFGCIVSYHTVALICKIKLVNINLRCGPRKIL